MGGLATGVGAALLAVVITLAPGSLEAPPPATSAWTAPEITGDPQVDQLIRSLAEDRGYQRRPLAGGDLVDVGGYLMRSDAAGAWRRLRAAAAAAGHDLRLVAAFRDIQTQRSLFLRRLPGHSAEAIDRGLQWTAPPGYSKHHTGVALDITRAGLPAGRFGSSGAYAWLMADSWHNARRFGFAPSYPPGHDDGPNPEPWEWIYLGLPDEPSVPD